jgi:trans-aconitate methyltransferase
MATAIQPVSDPTFRSYTAAQAKHYGTHRPSYAPALYDTILAHHAATGGEFQLLVDVGCGPGNATRDLARSFQRAVGVDAGAAMIGAARELGGTAQGGAAIRFEVSPAEEFSHIEGLAAGSVDMVISATAVRGLLLSAVHG